MKHPAEFVADLHLHSRYAYACSKNLTLPNIVAAAKTKGIGVLASADFTHPAWLAELEANLVPTDEGTFEFDGLRFVLGTEISCVYRQEGRGRRLHLLLLLSSFDAVSRFNAALAARGCKLAGDGRPSAPLSAPDLTSLALDIDPEAIVVPAHIWTPWYGMLGSKSGFDSIEECFGAMASQVHAVETGLSSDPAMNWAVPDIASRTIVSFSDAHSLPNLGREVTVFQGPPTYRGLKDALESNSISYTVEFYPEEGKYHYDGHRNCGVSQSPVETLERGDHCPECGRPMTLGVLNRVQSLASAAPDYTPEYLPEYAPDDGGLVRSPDGRPPFLRLVPLLGLLSITLGKGRNSKAAEKIYQELCHELGGEMAVLAKASASDLAAVAGERVALAVLNARMGQVTIEPGFDGQYGKVSISG